MQCMPSVMFHMVPIMQLQQFPKCVVLDVKMHSCVIYTFLEKMLCPKYEFRQSTDCPAQTSKLSFANNPQIGCTILGLHPMKRIKHGYNYRKYEVWPGVFNPQIAVKEVCKAWSKANPPKLNQEKESKVVLVKNHAYVY